MLGDVVVGLLCAEGGFVIGDLVVTIGGLQMERFI